MWMWKVEFAYINQPNQKTLQKLFQNFSLSRFYDEFVLPIKL